MRQEVRDTYITHPCSSGKETEVAATRIHTQVPQTCRGQTGAADECGMRKSSFPPQFPPHLPSGPAAAASGTPGSVPEHPGALGSKQASWHRFPLKLMGNECSHEREGFAATLHTRKCLTPRDLVEKPENVLLSEKSEQLPQPSPARSLISKAWNHSTRKSPLSSTHQPGASCSLWIHPKYLLSTKSPRGHRDEPVPPCAIPAAVGETPGIAAGR